MFISCYTCTHAHTYTHTFYYKNKLNIIGIDKHLDSHNNVNIVSTEF